MYFDPHHHSHRHPPEAHVKLVNTDIFEAMSQLDDHTINVLLATHTDHLDDTFDFETFWSEVSRIMTHSGVVLFMGKEPFLSMLRVSNPDYYRYDWTWVKPDSIVHPEDKLRPLSSHRNIAVFSLVEPYYRPVLRPALDICGAYDPLVEQHNCLYNEFLPHKVMKPRSVISTRDFDPQDRLNDPMTELVAYLLETYSKPGWVVFDPFAGSGSSAVQAIKMERNYIGAIESEKVYDKSVKRLDWCRKQLRHVYEHYLGHHHHHR